MSRFQLVLQNPSLDDLCMRFPHLRRYATHGYACDRRLHRNNMVGLFHEVSGRSIGVNLTSGKVCAI